MTKRRKQNNFLQTTVGTLSKDVFERRTSTGSEAFSLFICLDANKLVLLSLFSLLKTIYPRVSTKPLPNDAKSPLPVDVRRSKTLLLKLPSGHFYQLVHTTFLENPSGCISTRRKDVNSWGIKYFKGRKLRDLIFSREITCTLRKLRKIKLQALKRLCFLFHREHIILCTKVIPKLN